MTEQQIEMVKRISDKHGITADSLDKTLLLLGVGYGLEEIQIEQYLSIGEGKLLEKHMLMICLVLGIENRDIDVDSDMDMDGGGEKGVDYLQERLNQMLSEYYQPQMDEKGYKKLSQYILSDTELSAAQIEQLRLATEAGMPEKDVLVMARNKREPMEIKRCIEFYELVKSKEAEQKCHHSKWRK